MVGLIIAGILLVVAIGVGQWYAGERRRRQLEEWGRATGLTFSPEKAYGLDERYPDLDCLRSGSNRYAYNTLAGDIKGRRCLAFDYHYETHTTNAKGQTQTQHHYFSALILNSAVPLKPLLIRPEHFFDKVAEFFGADDIDFESAEFSRKFFVKSPDRRWAYDVIHPRMMEFLLASPGFHVEMDSLHVLVCRESLFSAADFTAAASLACGILQRLPEYLVKQQATEPL